MAKVLDGNYNNKKNVQPVTPKQNQFHNFEQRNYDFDDLESHFINQVNKRKEEPEEDDEGWLTPEELLKQWETSQKKEVQNDRS